MSAPAVSYLGIDVGGTKIAAGAVLLPEGRPICRRTIPTHPHRGGRAVLDDVATLSSGLASEAAALGHPVAAIGVGLCELVDRHGRVASANCIHWRNEPVTERLGVVAPACLEADVRAAALAESILGAGRPFRVFLYVTVGTGISCCLMMDGRPYLGANAATGTMGSSPIAVPVGPDDLMTNRTLEELASGPALVSRFNAAGGRAASGYEVVTAALLGDLVAARVVRTGAEALGSMVGTLIGTLDPEAVVVGGGLGSSDGPFWAHFEPATRRHVWSDGQRTLPILRAAAGADAGWIGAAAAAWRKQGHDQER